MALARLATPPAPKPTKAGLDTWLNSLNDSDRQIVLAAVVNTGWEHEILLKELVEEGAPRVSSTTFGSWRRDNGYVNR